jgi:hypothetical protein
VSVAVALGTGCARPLARPSTDVASTPVASSPEVEVRPPFGFEVRGSGTSRSLRFASVIRGSSGPPDLVLELRDARGALVARARPVGGIRAARGNPSFAGVQGSISLAGVPDGTYDAIVRSDGATGRAVASRRIRLAGNVVELAPEASPPRARVARTCLRIARSAATSVPTGGYGPAQIRHAYGFDELDTTGRGQLIAIVDAYGSPSVSSDLENFSSQFGLPWATLTVVYPSGKPKTIDPGWALETSLDVEWAHAIAPGASILLVVAPSDSMDDLLAAVDYASTYVDPVTRKRPGQVSMSWGSDEFPEETAIDPHFRAPGVSYFASSGDDGAGTIYPAVSPFVVAVGGTTLKLDSRGDVLSETAWSGSGGGASLFEVEPSWQRAFQASGRRQVPDVSYLADPATGFAVYDSTPVNGSSGWFQIGGTSAGAPQWAALAALVDAQRLAPLSGWNQGLYEIAGTSLKTYFRDIVSGSNATKTQPGFHAGPGYDEVTGLGSPRASRLVPVLVVIDWWRSPSPALTSSPSARTSPVPTTSPRPSSRLTPDVDRQRSDAGANR